MQGFGGETRGKESTWKTQARWEKNIKMDLQEERWGRMDWTDLAQDRGQLAGTCKPVMQGIIWLTENLLSSQEGLCSME